jgi:hypothetical protein
MYACGFGDYADEFGHESFSINPNVKNKGMSHFVKNENTLMRQSS